MRNPMILKKVEMKFTVLATPIDCLGITRSGEMVTLSMYSVPMFSTID